MTYIQSLKFIELIQPPFIDVWAATATEILLFSSLTEVGFFPARLTALFIGN
jgi:hypothetical protein